MARFPVIVFNAAPITGFQLRSQVQDDLAGFLQIRVDLAKRRIALLSGLRNLRVERIDTVSKLLNELSVRVFCIWSL